MRRARGCTARIGDERTALAIATWESKAARDASPALLPGAVQEIIESQAPFVEIRFIGEFEAPDSRAARLAVALFLQGLQGSRESRAAC